MLQSKLSFMPESEKSIAPGIALRAWPERYRQIKKYHHDILICAKASLQ
jgi:hypothetical protein